MMEGNLKSKLALVLVAAWFGAAAGQPVECDGYQYNCTEGQYCDLAVFKCRRCIDCAEFKRRPPRDHTNNCITSVVDCGDCFEGLTEDVQGLQCAAAPVSPAYVWVAIAAGGVLLFVAAVAIVVYVLRNTHTFRVFASTTSLQPSCVSRPPASAPEPPPPYNTLYTPVRPDSPPNAPLPPHFTDEEAASPFIKRPPPSTPAREAAGHQEANVYNNPSYVRGPNLPSDHHPAELVSEPEYLHDETTAESAWRPDDSANNNTHDNSEVGSSSGSSSAGAGAGGPLSAQLAAARGTTLVRPPCQDATPSKVPRLRQDTNNNRNNREREDEESLPRAGAGAAVGATFNILLNVQQVNDVKL
ncbi:CASP-like protein 4U1 isoform X2 [Leguminivora glycinivorella]|uniref:CASP-like protein 4U1 isoform X2 n=1 Tax=Leguminivora glycinivorella TaxID=1035111 RepID=UPI00200FFED3|nr:CASP-like protein 4U1 isoform X2 [Leguminivora glycinivorella]